MCTNKYNDHSSTVLVFFAGTFGGLATMFQQAGSRLWMEPGPPSPSCVPLHWFFLKGIGHRASIWNPNSQRDKVVAGPSLVPLSVGGGAPAGGGKRNSPRPGGPLPSGGFCSSLPNCRRHTATDEEAAHRAGHTVGPPSGRPAFLASTALPAWIYFIRGRETGRGHNF